jgi:hypothetical protein
MVAKVNAEIFPFHLETWLEEGHSVYLVEQHHFYSTTHNDLLSPTANTANANYVLHLLRDCPQIAFPTYNPTTF